MGHSSNNSGFQHAKQHGYCGHKRSTLRHRPSISRWHVVFFECWRRAVGRHERCLCGLPMPVLVTVDSDLQYESSNNYLAPILAYPASISSTAWTHLTVVYTSNKPALYVNGTPAPSCAGTSHAYCRRARTARAAEYTHRLSRAAVHRQQQLRRLGRQVRSTTDLHWLMIAAWTRCACTASRCLQRR